MTSSYNTPSWGINSTFVFDQTSSTPFSSGTQDMFDSTNRPGVFLMNGSQGNTTAYYPIFCSVSNTAFINVQNGTDDAYLVYPGYGFQLFNAANYSTQNNANYSYTYFNSSNQPVVFSLYTTATSLAFPNAACGVSSHNVTPGFGINRYPVNSTSSIRIYYRNTTSITISGIS
uniref:Uncharacterized protein n=1 Tax=viral metagenome TaxID=1070528 RepID=A0A6C0AS43_9ZZZZ